MEKMDDNDSSVKDELPVDSKENELEMDKSAYRLYLQLQVESPSLSFDIIKDNLGERVVDRGGDAVSSHIVAGTQAGEMNKNSLVVMRLSNMKPYKVLNDSDDDESDSDSSDDEDNLDSQPDVDSVSINHHGVVNRVKGLKIEDRYIAASWSDLGQVLFWDLSRPLQAINDSVTLTDYVKKREKIHPIHNFKEHKHEGYALDWNKTEGGFATLATGDCGGIINLYKPNPSGWSVAEKCYRHHKASVEDIQWSPTEPTVFISCSVDKSICIWDTRVPNRKPMINMTDAHPSDVNVCSWNALESHTLVSGGDEGSIRIWDLRTVQQNFAQNNKSDVQSYTHLFDFHKEPITSVEWHPSEAGMFMASSEDNRLTMWDISLEQDDETASAANEGEDVPVQLLFVHCGQEEIKECHWHPQMMGLVISTALDGFNIFRTANI